MRFLRWIFVLGIFLGSPAAGREIGRTSFGAWSIGSYTNDQTGDFSHCAASAPYRHGTSLLFSINSKYAWSMGLSNKNWSLTAGATYPVQYQVDRGPILSGMAEAISPSAVRIELLDNVSLFKLFKAGRTLRVQGAGQLFKFDLKDSSSTLEIVLRCANEFVQAGKTSSNPFAAGSPANIDAGIKAEAASVTANLLSAASITDFRMTAEAPPELSMFHAIWAAPGLLGGMQVAPNDNVDAAAARVLADDARACKGRFASATLPSQENTKSIKTVCDSDRKGSILTYILFPRPAGGIYLMVVTGVNMDGAEESKSSLPAEDASIKLLEAAYTLPAGTRR